MPTFGAAEAKAVFDAIDTNQNGVLEKVELETYGNANNWTPSRYTSYTRHMHNVC